MEKAQEDVNEGQVSVFPIPPNCYQYNCNANNRAYQKVYRCPVDNKEDRTIEEATNVETCFQQCSHAGECDNYSVHADISS